MQHKVRSIVISIDHRARGFHDTNNLVVCEREDIGSKLETMINSEFETKIVLQQKEIDMFKEQFNQEHPDVKRRVHSEMLIVKLLNKSKKLVRGLYKLPKKTVKKSRKLYKKTRRTLRKAKRFLKKKYISIRYAFFGKSTRKKELNIGQIMFFTFQGEYTCNPKYISEEIIRRKLPWKQVWVTLEGEKMSSFPEGVEVVLYNSRKYYTELGKSQILVDNAFNFVKGAFTKKEGQLYVETMHGSLGIKRIGPDDVDDKARNKRGYKCGEVTDVCISNSTFETFVYQDSFWDKENIYELGHARNDIFIRDEGQYDIIRKKVYDYFGLEKSAKLAMYAPTFRKNDDNLEKLDYENLKAALEQRFGGQWYILNRAHKSGKKLESDLNFVLDAGDYPDIQELMIAIEFAITDYSSWIYDYVLTRKAGMLFVPDLSDYAEYRGFYYPISETPYHICETNYEMYKAILDYDEKKQENEIDVFLEKRGCIDDGHASEHIVDLLEKYVETGCLK